MTKILHLVLTALLAIPAISSEAAVTTRTDLELRDLWERGDLDMMERIAGSGDVRAQRWMGLMLRNRGHFRESIRWYSRAAEQGDGYSANEIASFYEDGIGVARNPAQALNWNRKGAELGYAPSQHAYAVALDSGRLVPRDPGQAVRWYSAAAKQKYIHAYLPLAKKYAAGDGIARNPIRAYALAKRAEYGGDSSETDRTSRAGKLRRELASQLSVTELQQAEQLYAALRPQTRRGGWEWDNKLTEILAAVAGMFLGLVAAHHVLTRRA